MNTFRVFRRFPLSTPFFTSNFRPSTIRTSPQHIRTFRTFRTTFQQYRYVRFGDPAGTSSKGGLESFWRRLSPGQRLLIVGIGGGAPIFYVTHLETVEETGRRRFIFLSRNMEEALGKMVTRRLGLMLIGRFMNRLCSSFKVSCFLRIILIPNCVRGW